jgi:hypothetical protein
VIPRSSTLVVRAEEGGASANGRSFENVAVHRARSTGRPQFGTQPASVATSLARQFGQHPSHDRVNSTQFTVIEISCRPTRVEPGPQQDLVDQHVAETGHHSLIEQGRFEWRSPSTKSVDECSSVDAEGVRAESAIENHRFHSRETSRIAQQHLSPPETKSETDPLLVI